MPAVKWIRIATTLAVFAISAGLYLWTLAPTVTLVDSGELIVAARVLGVAHPPGFPLYVLLAHLASLLPLGSVAVRVNGASALFGASAATMITLAVWEAVLTPFDLLSDRTRPVGRKSNTVSKTAGARIAGRPADTLNGWAGTVALFAGLLFCTSRTLWAYATVTEVYTLNTLMIALIVFFMLRWRRRVIEVRRDAGRIGMGGTSSHDRWLNAAALAFGLAVGVHHVTVVLMLPAFGVLVLATEGRKFFASRRLPIAALFACIGACVYIYLPVAAAQSPVMDWGDPRTLDRFVAHVTGWQYQVYLEARPEQMGRQVSDFCMRALREFGPVWFPLAILLSIAGSVLLYRRMRPLFWFLMTTAAANLAYNVNYEIAEDKDAYYLPVFMVIAVAAAFGVRFLAVRISASSRGGYLRNRLVAGALLLTVPGAALASNYRFDNRREYFVARDYVENILKTVEPGGMLLTLDWQVYSPYFYLREIEGYRRDAVVIDVNQLRRSWYFSYLDRAFPQVMNRVRPQEDAFLAELRHWERDPALYQRDPVLNQRISATYQNLILTVIADHLRHAPVYVTQEIATYPPGQDESPWVREMIDKYQIVPEGLVFRVFADQQFHDPVHPALVTRGLTDGTLHFSEDDVVMVKVLPVYVGMAFNRGRYLARAGRHRQAIAAFEEALAMDPALSAARQALRESQDALRQRP